MSLQFDATVVDAWTEFIRLRERGVIEELDEKSRTIIYMVAAAEARGEKISQNCLLRTLKPRSSIIIVRRIDALAKAGWLEKEKNLSDGRRKNLRLTPKAIAMVNLLSGMLKTVVRQAAETAPVGVAPVLDYERPAGFRPAPAFQTT